MKGKSIALIVAHPDDETLWAGGTILGHTEWKWYIISLCRKSDQERATKFFGALKILGAEGVMGDLDDGPEQFPLDEAEVKSTILDLLPHRHFDILVTHHPYGEYTRHLRHEETARAVIHLWNDHMIEASSLWTFAYHDGGGAYPPKADVSADILYKLPESLWRKKYALVIDHYGFSTNSFEAKATTHEEAFWHFDKREDAIDWLNKLTIRQ